jgi:hypothetical protein
VQLESEVSASQREGSEHLFGSSAAAPVRGTLSSRSAIVRQHSIARAPRTCEARRLHAELHVWSR